MVIALFVSNFLEPTHHAIRQVLNELDKIKINVYAKRILSNSNIDYENVISANVVEDKLDCPNVNESNIVQTIYDGDLSFLAGKTAKKHKKPLIVSFHGGHDTNSKIYNDKYINRTKLLLDQATLITVVSRIDYSRLSKLAPCNKILIVPVPIDLKTLPIINQHRNKFNLIVVSRLIPKKGVDKAIKVLSLLPERYRLTIVGEGELNKDLKELAKSCNTLNRIVWTGLLPYYEMLNRLNDSSLLLHFGRIGKDGNAEGTPQIILLAQALKIPVVTTLTGSIGEIVENNKTGFVVEDDNIELMSDCVRSVLESETNRSIIDNGYDQVRKYHSLNRVIDMWNDIYSKVVVNG